ncbi:MAG: hypothetical protein AM1032_000309 [Mycoplasmataceae bacterium]|nr:MAG: hypothetical protein AM1032_000309 [Mycoplasmataceae bacterium]
MQKENSSIGKLIVRLADWSSKFNKELNRDLKDSNLYDKTSDFNKFVSGILPAFFTLSNYFGLLDKSEKSSKKGIAFLILSIIYASFCIYLSFFNK